VYQSGQSGVPQAHRIAFAFASRRYDPRGDSLENDMRLSFAMKSPAGVVESLTHNSRRMIVERAIAWLHESPN